MFQYLKLLIVLVLFVLISSFSPIQGIVGQAVAEDAFKGLSPTFARPRAAVIDEGFLYVANNRDASLTVMDLKTNAIKARVPTFGLDPIAIAVNPQTKRLYLVNATGNSVTVLDISKIKDLISGKSVDPILAVIRVGKAPHEIAVNQKTNKIFVINRDSQDVSVINGETNKVIQTFKPDIGNYATTFALNPEENKLYIPNTNKGRVLVLNTETGAAKEIAVSAGPYYAQVDRDLNRVYVTNFVSDTLSVIDGSSDKIIKEIKTGPDPELVDFNPISNKIYVINYLDASVSVIDRKTLELIKTIGLGPDFYAKKMAIDPLLNKIYLSVIGDNKAAVIDGEKDEVIKTFTVGQGVREVKIDSVNHKAYILSEDDNLFIIDGTTNEGAFFSPVKAVTKKESLAFDNPSAILINSKRNRVYVANNSNGTVTVINGKTDKYFKVIKVGENPRGMVLNPKEEKLYVALGDEDTVAVISEKDFSVKKIPVGIKPRTLRYSSELNRVYVTNYSSDSISVIDGKTDQVIETVSVGKRPSSMVIDSKAYRLYVANYIGDSISAVDLNSNKVIGTINNLKRPYQLSVDVERKKLYASSYGSDVIFVLDVANSLRLTDTLKSGFSVFDMRFDAKNNRLYTANYTGDSVSLIDLTTKETTNIPLNDHPLGMAFDKKTGYLYVQKLSAAISVIDTAAGRIIKDISVGRDPAVIALNEKTEKLYVANKKGNSLSVIDIKTNERTHNISDASKAPKVAAKPKLNKTIIYAAVAGLLALGAVVFFILRKRKNQIAPPQV